ncbi:DUF2268 domain-containing protein [Fredinandcohnia humi]
MGVIRTDNWLTEMYSNPVTLCKKLISYFPKGTSEREIYHHLHLHGMYQPLEHVRESPLDSLPVNIWDHVNREYKKLQKEWNGPDVPIFLFPSDETNRRISREFNGKSGLAFHNKLFLFFVRQNTKEEIKAVLTHEYNHVCRLSKYKNKEADYTLLDTIILEGMAENAVRERCGDRSLARWTSYYSENQLEGILTKIIQPNFSLNRTEKKHNDLLYGKGFYPKMAGYCTGYYLVKNYLEANNLKSNQVLEIGSEKFIEGLTKKH